MWLSGRLAREPTDEEIAEAAKLPVEEVAELRELTRGLTSLDQPVGEDGETALGDLLASDRPDPVQEIADAERDRKINDVVAQLPEAERNVIRLRFGLSGDEPRSLRQTGTELGIPMSQARELEAQGLGGAGDGAPVALVSERLRMTALGQKCFGRETGGRVLLVLRRI